MKLISVIRRSDPFWGVCTGELYFNGRFLCYTLEDTDRNLHQLMTPQAVEQIKIQDRTAIPYGFYEVVIDMSARFQQLMPHILNVTGFSGIRIHRGNTDADTRGCILLGKSKSLDTIGLSRMAYEEFFTKLTDALKTERVFISVTR